MKRIVIDALPIARASLHQELVSKLRALIADGTLGAGMKVPERELCASFGVSRTPLREALKVLAAEGAVSLSPNRGATVSVLTADQLDEVRPVLVVLESLIGRMACEHGTEAELRAIRRHHEAMVGHWKDGDTEPYIRCNQRIHEAILEATHNSALRNTYRSLAARIMNARFLVRSGADDWRRSIDEHEAILAALEARDGAALSRCLAAHLDRKLTAVGLWLSREAADS